MLVAVHRGAARRRWARARGGFGKEWDGYRRVTEVTEVAQTSTKEGPMADQPAPDHDQLPLPDYDHLAVDSLESRIQPLADHEVQVLLAYERTHGDRPPVVRVLQARLGAWRES